MEFRYTKESKRLNIYGTDCEHDIQTVKKLIEEEKIPKDIETIVYQKNRTSVVAMMIRGVFLQNLLKPNSPESNTPSVIRPGIKSILKAINETNARQSTYAGLLVYSMETRRFLLFTPRNRNNHVFMLGDNPMTEAETPVEIVCRVAREDISFEDSDPLEIDPSWLVELKSLEIDGTMYHGFLLVVEREFKPKLSEKLLNVIWAQPEAFKELKLHPSVVEVFDKDHKLQKLTKPENDLDYDKLIEHILHAPKDEA
jgi:hypothetical protein